MKLYYTPRSHFSRKVRILLDALALPYELINAGNVAEASAGAFGPNPLLKVPSLVDGANVVFESDHIAQYLTRNYRHDDPFSVLTDATDVLNARSVMNGIMAAEVELILAARAGIDTLGYARFDKLRAAITNGLCWLDANASCFPAQPSYGGFHLVAMWDHLELYGVVPLPFSALRAHARHLSELVFVSSSKPS